MKKIQLGLTFDDVLLIQQYSGLIPEAVINTKTPLCRDVNLKIPFISAAMDTVTGSAMAIAMARNGGIGILHRNQSIEQQCAEIITVKRNHGNMITDPVTLNSSSTISTAEQIMQEYGFGTFPVVDNIGNLVGLVNKAIIGLSTTNPKVILSQIMIPFEDVLCAFKTDSIDEIKNQMIRSARKMVLILESATSRKLVGIYFQKDLDNQQKYPHMVTDKNGRLLVGAAIGVANDGYERAEALIQAGVDVLCVDTAQGYSAGVGDIVKRLKKDFPNTPIIAGNVATTEAAQFLIDAGADAIKVGIGPGAICTTREITGYGMPQFSAILNVAQATKPAGIPLIADGGIKNSGDIVKALAAGASTVMMGSMFAGTDEAPGTIIEEQGSKFKIYRGMGSVEAIEEGKGTAADRYLSTKHTKKVAEGVSGLIPYKGTVQNIIDNFLTGVTQTMRVYAGCTNIPELQNTAQFIQQTQLGRIESGTRDIKIK